MIWIILLSGFILRLISLNQSLWLDEAINIVFSQKYSLWEMLTQYSIADFHPPGYFALIWGWGRLFGFSEISARLPSVIFGILAIYLVYLIGKKLISKEVGLISAALLAINSLHIYYSQEARMYSLATLAVSLNVLLLIKLVKGEKVNIIYLIFSNLLVLLSDYVAYLIFPAELVFIASLRTKNLFIFINKLKFLKRWFINLIVSLIVFSWWIPVFLKQLNTGSMASSNLPAWKEVVGATGLKPLALTYVKFIIGRVSFTNQLVYGVISLLVGLLFLFLIWRGLKFTNNPLKKLVLSWLLVPVILASLVSVFIPIYSYFRLLFVLPAFLILIAFGISSLKLQFKWFFLGLVVTIEIIFTVIYLLNPQFQREDWRSLVNFLKEQPKESKVLFESSGSFTPFDYYAGNGFKGIGALKNFPAKSEADLIDLRSVLGETKDVYLINYLVDISDPNRLVGQQLTELGFSQPDIKNFNGVGFVYHFVKNE